MNFLTGAFSLLGRGAARGAGAAFRRPVVGGAIIGGAGGLLTSDANTLTQRLQDAGRGMMTGAAMGALMPGTGMGLWSGLWKNKGNLYRAGRGIGALGLKAGRFALEHPLLVGAVGGGAYAATQLMGNFGQTLRSPTLQGAMMKADYNQQAMQAADMASMFVTPPGVMGSAPQYQEQMMRFRNSTAGLVQGLHSGRHG